MKAEHESQSDPADDLLRRAVQAVLTQPVPGEVRQRLIETVATWECDPTAQHPQRALPVLPSGSTSGLAEAVLRRVATSSNSRRRGWGLAAAAVCVAIVMTMLWLSYPKASWAQVAEALRKKPWSLAKYTTPDGVLHEDWISFTRDISAHRFGDSIQFSDHRLNVTYGYNANERTLTRYLDPEPRGTKEAGRWFESVFQQISRGAEQLDLAVPGIELVEQKRESVTKHGKLWVSYELTTRVSDVDAAEQKAGVRLTFLVDPQTHLPHYLVMGDAGMNPPLLEMELSYPETGPIDIYDFGVPRDAKLVDRVPANDVRRVISEVKLSGERFEKHLALNVMSNAGSPWYAGTPFVVWRQGTSSRMVYGLVDTVSAAPATPQPGVNQQEWWKRRWTELFHVPHEICDGSTFWSNEAQPAGWQDEAHKPNPVKWSRAAWPRPKWKSRPERNPWPAGSSPLFVAYPQNLVNFRAGRRNPEIDLSSPDGPPNTIKIVVRTAAPGSSSGEERYWIDTQRSHMVVRYELSATDATKSPPVQVINHSQIVEAADRSPQGIWYPTRIRHVSRIDDHQTLETITRHYLDFDVRFAADLFSPVERPGEPLE